MNQGLQRAKRWAWPAILILSPLALAAGLYLLNRLDPNLHAGLTIDRQLAIEMAREHAQWRGIDVRQWQAFCRVEQNNERYFYYRMRPPGNVRMVAPEVTARILFFAPKQNENLEIEMAPDGRVLGFTRQFRAGQPFADPGEAATRALAVDTLRTSLEANALVSVAPEMTESRGADGVVRRYAWKWPVAASVPELDRQYVVTVRGNAASSAGVEAKIDPAFARKYLNSNPLGLIGFGVAYGLIVLVVLVFGIYRFVKRAQQKEVSYGRVLLLALLTASIFGMFLVQTDVAVYQGARLLQPGPIWINQLFSCIIYIFLGMLIGLAYGSGEGDIREAYPGKLTSLDALLMGKVFSRNVGQAFAVGLALGSWALLLLQLTVLLWAGRPEAGWQLSERLEALFAHLPWATHLYGWLSYAVLSIVVGVLLPLPFLHRRLKNPRLVWGLLSVFVWGSCLLMSVQLRPWAAVISTAAVYAATLLIAFARFDLLTANIAVGIPALASAVMMLLAQPAPSIHQAGWITTSILGALFAVNLVCAFRGRLYQEDEVRPRYASFLAERQSMQAEVAAAREAQVRLLPQTLPQMPRLSIGAACRPAKEVGGDFYDFFPLDADKLGLFMAEGGGQGLAAALSIAFAKGFLMPRIQNEVGGDDSPLEIVRGLQTELLAMRPREDADAEDGLGYLFAVIDSAERTLRYARAGKAPEILICGNGRDAAPRRPEEQETRFALDRSGERVIRVASGMCSLEVGESVLLYTDGVAKTWSEATAGRNGLWEALMAQHPHVGPHLNDALQHAIRDGGKQAQRKGIEDDLTAVVIRVERAGSGEKGASE